MKDLRDAIKQLVENCEDSNWTDDQGVSIIIVDNDSLETLVAEYNIHFVEPEEEQLKTNTWKPFK